MAEAFDLSAVLMKGDTTLVGKPIVADLEAETAASSPHLDSVDEVVANWYVTKVAIKIAADAAYCSPRRPFPVREIGPRVKGVSSLMIFEERLGFFTRKRK
mmetsp:Transcript_9968/g.13851  ORF Transcript_9968/g.13851 Transcript_9968/m.13851 type:complete len:101 (+) Transcript_9968:6314-6616(+)